VLRRKGIAGELKGWRRQVGEIFYRPCIIILWILAVGYVINVLGTQFDFPLVLSYINPLRNAAIISCFGWVCIRWKSSFYRDLLSKQKSERKSLDIATLHIFSKLITIAIVVITIFLILQVLGVNVMPLVAFGGIGAATIGFASKDVIANFFGGMMLHISRPFTTGDLIVIPNLNTEGHVEEIGWYLTAIRDKEKRPVYLPNALFSTLLVINSSRMTHRRIEERIGLRYEDFSKLNPIIDAISKMFQDTEEIDQSLPIIVNFTALKDFSLTLYIDVYTLTTRLDQFLNVKEDILQKVYKIIISHGADVSYPTTSIDLTDRSISLLKK